MVNVLSSEIKKIIIEFVNKNIIKKEDTYDLFKAHNEKTLIDILSKLLKITNDEKNILWLHIVNSQWNNLNDIYSPKEIMLLKYLINKNGVISRIELLKNVSSFKNNYCLNSAVDELIDIKIINKIQLTNSKILYILSSNLLKEIRCNE